MTATPDPTIARVADRLTWLGERLDLTGSSADAITLAASKLIDEVTGASITVREGGGYRSLAASDEETLALDQLQYSLGAGPCLDALKESRIIVVPDLGQETRWPDYCAAAVTRGVRGLLAYRLYIVGQDQAAGALNLYTNRPRVFDEDTIATGAVLAAHAALAVSLQLAHEKTEQLETALRTNRDIATAVGLIMGRHGMARERALELLRVISQTENKKMALVARELIGSAGS